MHHTRWWRLVAALAALAVLAGACGGGGETEVTTPGGADGDDVQTAGGLLDAVRERGTLSCGVNDAVPGFGFSDAEGNFSGFDVDYCRAVAAGVLGDPDAVEYRPLTAQQRFTALQSGDIDVLIRNTTWTAARDGREGGRFLTTTFYDGQGMMVRTDSGVTEIADLADATICVLSGTTTELNLASRFNRDDIPFEPLSFEDNETLQDAFTAGRCEGWTSDKSQLAAIKSNWPEARGGPDALTILDETFSKEPLGPVVRDGDATWAAAVDWIVIATIQAEEFGITSSNVGDFTDSDNPEIRRFLGVPEEGEAEPFDPGLGLDPDFAVDVIQAVGNYAEIYERNVGPDTALGLERGPNRLWTEGGLLYPPPYR